MSYHFETKTCPCCGASEEGRWWYTCDVCGRVLPDGVESRFCIETNSSESADICSWECLAKRFHELEERRE